LIISVGNIAENNPVMGVKIKTAAQKKAKLVSISNGPTRMTECANLSLKLDNSLAFLKSLIKALLDGGYVNQTQIENSAVNLTQLSDYVKDAPASEAANQLAKMYGEAKKAIFVIDDNIVTADAIKLLADIAVITGKIGKPHSGIILMRSNCNSQGFIDMGIKVPGLQIIEQINAGKIKAILIVGEDPAGTDPTLAEALKKLDFVVTLDTFATATTALSNIVIPIGSFAEAEGTFTRSDRKIQAVNPAISLAKQNTVFATLAKLGQYLGIKIETIKQATELLSAAVPGYSGLYLAQGSDASIYAPNNRSNPLGSQVLYTDGYNKADKKAVLSLPEGDKMFVDKQVYDTIQKKFKAYLAEKGLK
jgi:formate dehydrogenase major subunit